MARSAEIVAGLVLGYPAAKQAGVMIDSRSHLRWDLAGRAARVDPVDDWRDLSRFDEEKLMAAQACASDTRHSRSRYRRRARG
jgi:hypothetical protein